METFNFFVLGKATHIKKLFVADLNTEAYYGYSCDACVTSKGRFMILNCKCQLPINTMVTFTQLSATVQNMVGFALSIRLFMNVIKYDKVNSKQNHNLKQQAMEKFIGWMATALRNIQDYNDDTESYSNLGYKCSKLQCVNAIFNDDMPNTRQYNTILCRLQQYNHHKTSKKMDCYVFNCQSAKKIFSIISWNIDGKFKKIFDNKLKCGTPIIVANLKFDTSIPKKPYFQTCNNSIIFHSWCPEISDMFFKGESPKYGVDNAIETFYIWMNDANEQIEDVRFYQDIKLAKFTNLIKAVDHVKNIAGESKDQKGKALFLLPNKNITSWSDVADMDANLKHYCNFCRKVYQTFDPVCQHMSDVNPWLEIKLKIQFTNAGIAKTLDVVVLLEAIKSMYNSVQGDMLLDISDTADFILNTFEHKQQWKSQHEARYFIPIVYSFFKNKSNSNAVTTIQVNKSRNYCNYYITDVSSIIENTSPQQNANKSECSGNDVVPPNSENNIRKSKLISNNASKDLQPPNKKRKFN